MTERQFVAQMEMVYRAASPRRWGAGAASPPRWGWAPDEGRRWAGDPSRCSAESSDGRFGGGSVGYGYHGAGFGI